MGIAIAGRARGRTLERIRPIVEEIGSAHAPDEACARFLDLPYCLLLESVSVSERMGRYSFLMADPFRVLRSKGDAVEIARPGRRPRRLVGADPFDALRAALERYGHDAESVRESPPFQGGAAGYLAYDLLHSLERVPPPRWDDLALPDMCIGFYDWVLAWDHMSGRASLFSTGLPETDARARVSRAASRAAAVRRRLGREARGRSTWTNGDHHLDGGAVPSLSGVRSAGGRWGKPTGHGTRSAFASDRRALRGPGRWPVPDMPSIASTFSRAAYHELVGRVREYILAGDVFQANVSQRLETRWDASPFSLYRRLRRHNPAAFAAYFDIGDAAIVSASPERFLRVNGDLVETRPIKGTAPRGVTPMHDLALERALHRSEKDRAENVMIVDLLRNDLSRVCRDHTVDVPELWRIERFPSVQHLVSTVTGRLRKGVDAIDVLRATFPGGSITGAPKVRAMQIIHELEPTRRGVYTGAVGYIGFDGTMDTSIAIRTFIVKDGTAYLQVGGGIVADSDAEREYTETLNKAEGLITALT